MLARLKPYTDHVFSALIGLFFVLILHFKASYSAIPILLAVAGIVLLFPYFKQKNATLSKKDKWLIGSFLFYFILFVLSLIIHSGKGRELDLPSRALLALPILAIFYQRALKSLWIIYALIGAGIIAGITALIQIFGLGLKLPFPKMMHIQAGGIAMSLAIFAFASMFYFFAQKKKGLLLVSLFAVPLAMVASFLTGARGAWVGAPIVLLLVFWFNRKNVSKWITSGVIFIFIASGLVANKVIQKRYAEAERDIKMYVEKNNSCTSLGARFDMWESALLGIQEKPLFGWGLQGVNEMRQQHSAEGKISKCAAQYTHAHNQYLHDASARGVLGLVALLGIFFVPLIGFWQNLKHSAVGSEKHFWNVLGISHILLVMSYSLSQSFLSHNSGVMFYFVTLIFFWGLQKKAKNDRL